MRRLTSIRVAPLLALITAAVSATGCSVNPATGARQLILVSEAQEIEMGREADGEIVPSLGLVDDPALQRYVQELGERMALSSERPGLPWTFRVVDDATVNAFALPGGYIYVTRGILAHFTSEAELAGVLGHEIGHVTARHGASQMSRAQLAQIGLGVSTILAPDLAGYANLAGAGLQVLFLRYGREDERQADDLGLRYMSSLGYDPREMAATFEMLADASGAGDGARIPGFLSTHPDPLSRRDRILGQVQAGVAGTRVERDSYVQRLEGMTFGVNPRAGYFEGTTFLHPDLAFGIDFPAGWSTANAADAVHGTSPEGDATVVLAVDDAASPREARDRFAQSDLRTGNARDTTLGGFPAASVDFVATTDGGAVEGTALFVAYGGRVFQILGFAVQARWPDRAGAVRTSVESFRRVTDPAVLGRQPDHVTLVRIPAAMTLEAFHQRYPSTIPIEQVGTINRADAGMTIPSGTLMKRVVAGSR